MEKFKCPRNETIVVTKEYINTHCKTHRGCEQLQKCLEKIRKNEEKITDEVVLEPSTIYLGFDGLGMA